MPYKTPALIAALLTVILLVVFGILSIFIQLVALNGVSERQGVSAMGISLVCQGLGMVLAGMLAWRLTDLTITKFNWNKILAVLLSLVVGTLVGGFLSFFSILIAIPLAGIR